MVMNAKSSSDPRSRVVDALMSLAAEQPWNAFTLSDIAQQAEISLADLRDLFPSKGAILGAFVRRIDRIILDSPAADMADQEARERVLDLMMRRLDALSPYRAALKSIHEAFSGDLAGMFALNQQGLNSWRYLLDSIGIGTEGPLGLMKIQGAILVFSRAFPVFLGEEDAGLPASMAALDRELKRGEWVLARAEGVDRFFAPFRGFCRATKQARAEQRGARSTTATG